MDSFNVASRAAFLGAVFFAVPALDVLLGDGPAGMVHAIVAGFGLALLAVSAAANAGR